MKVDERLKDRNYEANSLSYSSNKKNHGISKIKVIWSFQEIINTDETENQFL